MVTSHPRPTEGEYNEEFPLLPVVNYLKDKSVPVRPVKDYPTALTWPKVSWWFWKTFALTGERKTMKRFSLQKYAALCDVFVMDAFGTAHRAQASTHGIGTLLMLRVQACQAGR